MSIDNLASISLSGALVVALAGCGSSSGSSSEPQVGSEPPSVLLTGFVIDNPIQDATVTATVNGQSFTADQPTASDGSYSIEVSSDNPDALVRLEATDTSGATRLSAIVDSFEAIEEVVADATVAPDFNITNVTTAQEVLATRLTDDGSIDSKEELIDTVGRVRTDDLLEVSAAIKLVVDGIDGVQLPSDVQDTLALAEAIVDGTSTFIDDVETSAPGALDNAVDQLLTDGNATIAFEAASVAGVYISEDNFSIFAIFPAGYGYTEPQGEGSATFFDWTISESGVLNLFLGGSEPRTQVVTLLGRTDEFVNVVVRESGDSSSGSPTTARYIAFEGEFTSENVPGSYSSLNDPERLTVFAQDGTGADVNLISGVEEDTFSWSIDADGVLMLTDADGSVTSARRLTGSTDDNPLLLISEQGPTGELENVSVVDVLRSTATVGSDEANALLLAGKTYAVTEADELGLFKFATNGSMQEIVQRQADDGVWEVNEGSGTWTINETGVVNILFPGETAASGAAIVQGLGEDFMVVEPLDDPTNVMQVTRVLPVESALIAGSFNIQDETTGEVSGTVRFAANFTGVFVDVDGTSEDLEWSLSSDGRLQVATAGEAAFDNETVTLHMLAGSSGDLFRFVAVHRVNGELVDFDASTGELPETMEILTLIRNGN